MLAAAAFWLIPDQKIIRAKLIALQASMLLAGASLLWRGMAKTDRATEGRPLLDACVGALSLSGALFWALSPDHTASETEAARLFFCGLTYWAASRSFAAIGASAFSAFWTLTAACAGLWALAQVHGGQTRPFASFGNPIFLGVSLAAALPLALAGASIASKSRPLWIAAALIELSGLFLTQSRTAVFGLLAAFTLWAAARLKRRSLLAALVAITAATVAAGVLFWNREWTHALIWRDTLAMWRANPWLGCGLGRFHLEFPAHASAELKARWPAGAVIINFAHNEYLQTLAETGPLGLAVLISVPLAAWLTLRREPPDAWRDACAIGALSLFCAAFTAPDLRFGASAFAAFALLGASAPVTPRPAVASSILISLALVVFAWLSVKSPLAVRRNASQSPFHAGADPRRIAELENRLALQPNDADAAEALGFLKAKASDFTGAAAAFRRAHELSASRPGPLNNLGNLAYLSGDARGAVDWWTRSLAAAPEQIDARINLAKLLCELGRLKECAANLKEVIKRDPSNSQARVLYKKMIE